MWEAVRGVVGVWASVRNETICSYPIFSRYQRSMKILFGKHISVPTFHESIDRMTCPQTFGKIVGREKARFFLPEFLKFGCQRTLFQGVFPFSKPSYSLGNAPFRPGLVDLPGFLDDVLIQRCCRVCRHIPDAQDGMPKALYHTNLRHQLCSCHMP